MAEKPLLTTAWTHLAMLNYEIDPSVLRPHVPSGTELDEYGGRTFVSVVGFRFQRARVWGVAVPFHRSFAEVNLRFYVRRRTSEGVRRGVVFLKEVVALPAVAWTARALYDENFSVLPVRWKIDTVDGNADAVSGAMYEWKFRGTWQKLAVTCEGRPQVPVDGSEEQFIAEHYWGYTRRRDGTTAEFRVDHPPWRAWRVTASEFRCDAANLYGPDFASPLGGEPSSAFLAEGSEVSVFPARRLKI